VTPNVGHIVNLSAADFRDEMIELRLHGVQPLAVEVNGLHQAVKEAFKPIEALLDQLGFAEQTSGLALISGR